MTSTEAAEYARCNRSTITLAANSGQLVGHQRKAHSRWLFLQSDIDRWINKRDKTDQQPVPDRRTWLTTSEAAELARCSRNAVIFALQDGELSGYQHKSPNGHWRTELEDLTQWRTGGFPLERIMTPQDAAARLGCHQEFIYRALWSNELANYKFRGTQWIIDSAKFDEWLAGDTGSRERLNRGNIVWGSRQVDPGQEDESDFGQPNL
ncbi:helix-turn-helix domain-containing protein [Rhodococcus sp. IEGM 1409]|uniref:helix-turn-helix domain-containing protein n=1 Tax=Rhodococcus sp. IEGM 1409 TaxID=3047082 RepID=UPI0024B6D6E5|nr:helix-turn-helix domain-containing protein [Rhodococcus sp. IEGM 1409]MDI9900277.1 helix-turn-helix domain-containing protein [Rhodococcus sp. IEGM 1409]